MAGKGKPGPAPRHSEALSDADRQRLARKRRKEELAELKKQADALISIQDLLRRLRAAWEQGNAIQVGEILDDLDRVAGLEDENEHEPQAPCPHRF